MMCFRDRTYCNPSTCKGTCDRVFTEQDRKDATKWWDGEDFPLCVGDFCNNKTSETADD